MVVCHPTLDSDHMLLWVLNAVPIFLFQIFQLFFSEELVLWNDYLRAIGIFDFKFRSNIANMIIYFFGNILRDYWNPLMIRNIEIAQKLREVFNFSYEKSKMTQFIMKILNFIFLSKSINSLSILTKKSRWLKCYF